MTDEELDLTERMMSQGISVEDLVALIKEIKDLLALKESIAAMVASQHRIEQKLDDALAGRFTPEQAAQLDELKAKIEANDAKIESMKGQ